jgi:hypothetical protein
VIALAPAELKPATWTGVQCVPLAEVQIAASCRPGGPDRVAAVRPPEPMVRAVMTAPVPAGPNGARCQLAPSSADSSANATVPPAVVSRPRAATRSPLIATC